MGAVIGALYCHIPFCHTICPFCAFAVHGDKAALHGPYLEALEREILRRGEALQGPSQRISTLYIGGGTPSTLSLAELRALLAALARHFPFAPGIEIAFEINPEDARPDYLAGLRKAGVTRLSLGLQSLSGSSLVALGRNNGPEQGLAAAEAVAAHGPANFNLDLMCGAPHQPAEAFRRDVARVAELRPPHLSLYGLDLEPGTLFARSPAVRQWAAGHGEAQGEALLWASTYLSARGYRHYEVSNFCRPGREGRQNLAVWSGENYLGFGAGAHSCVDGVRWQNHRHLRAYTRAVGAGEFPVAFEERLTPEQRANEALMLALRRAEGLAIGAWEENFGFAWGEGRKAVGEKLAAAGQARVEEGVLALTPKGMLVADAITAELMVG